jgi:glycosyltransferase involved in cell wall biosynthesis
VTPYDFVFFSSSDWEGKWGSRQQVSRQLSRKGNRVLFVEQMASWEHFWRYPDLRRRRRERRRQGLQEIEPRLWLATPPPLLPGRYYSIGIAGLNAGRVRRWVRPILRHMNITRPILWCYKPEQADLVGRLEERAAVYHCIDEMTVGTHGRKQQVITKLERDLLRRVDVVFANSRITHENKRPFNPHTYHVPSGADVHHFGKALQPGDIDAKVSRLPHPILMFVGNVNEKVDVDLLAHVAQHRPSWSIVLVGQAFPESVSLINLERSANTCLLGKRPFAALPALLRAADICLLPYVAGDATRYRSPLKLYEYLATGKPIISTPHPEVDEFRHLVTIVPPGQFVSGIEKILETDTAQNQQQRLEAAQQHSWEVRVDSMLARLDAVLSDG